MHSKKQHLNNNPFQDEQKYDKAHTSTVEQPGSPPAGLASGRDPRPPRQRTACLWGPERHGTHQRISLPAPHPPAHARWWCAESCGVQCRVSPVGGQQFLWSELYLCGTTIAMVTVFNISLMPCAYAFLRTDIHSVEDFTAFRHIVCLVWSKVFGNPTEIYPRYA